MSMSQLVSHTFTADDPHKRRFRVHKEQTVYYNFNVATVNRFGWDLISLFCRPIILKSRRHYGLLGVGQVVSADLRSVFSGAGFSEIFVFTTVAEKVKRPISNFYDHFFEPKTAEFDIRVALREGSNQPDWEELNSGVSNYTLMAALKAPA